MSTVAVLLAFALGLINYIITPSFVVHRSGVVVITGASTGIGRSSAIKLATLGFTVVAGVRKDSDGKDILKSVEGSPYATFIKPIIIDVTNSATLDAAVVASQGFGPVVAVVSILNPSYFRQYNYILWSLSSLLSLPSLLLSFLLLFNTHDHNNGDHHDHHNHCHSLC
jgi:hypothetical protein